MKDFMMGVFGIVESEVFTPSNLTGVFSEVGLWPWNPDLIRELCQIHCPPPSQLNSTPTLKELERIMYEMIAEREIERDKIIALGRSMRLGLSNETGRYHLRVKKSAVPQVRKVVLRSSIRVKKPTSSELEPPKKVRRRMETVPEPQ